MRLKYSPQAAADIRAAVTWWRANRPAARGLLREELRRAVALLKAQPQLGGAALEVELGGVRRYHLTGSRYYLYYRLKDEQLEVLRLWHASRGSPPQL